MANLLPMNTSYGAPTTPVKIPPVSTGTKLPAPGVPASVPPPSFSGMSEAVQRNMAAAQARMAQQRMQKNLSASLTTSYKPYQPTQFAEQDLNFMKSAPIQPGDLVATPPIEGDSQTLAEYQAQHPGSELQFDPANKFAGWGVPSSQAVIQKTPSGGYYVEDPGNANTIVHEPRGAWDQTGDSNILNGLSPRLFQIDHKTPLFAGGLNVAGQKQILPVDIHESKTKVQAVPLTIWRTFNNNPELAKQYGMTPMSLADMRSAIDSWQKYSDVGVPTPDQNGEILDDVVDPVTGKITKVPMTAVKIWKAWQEPKKMGIMDTIKSIPNSIKQGAEEIFSGIPIIGPAAMGAVQGLANGITLGYAKKYAPDLFAPTDWTAVKARTADITSGHGTFTGQGKWAIQPGSFWDTANKGLNWLDSLGQQTSKYNATSQNLGGMVGELAAQGMVFAKIGSGMSAFGEMANAGKLGSITKSTVGGLVKGGTAADTFVSKALNLPAKAWQRFGPGKTAIEAVANTEKAAAEAVTAAEGIGPATKIASNYWTEGGVAKVPMVAEEYANALRATKTAGIIKNIGIMNVHALLSQQDDRSLKATMERALFSTISGKVLGADAHNVAGYMKVFSKGMTLGLMEGGWNYDGSGQQDIFGGALQNALMLTALHGAGHGEARPMEKQTAMVGRYAEAAKAAKPGEEIKFTPTKAEIKAGTGEEPFVKNWMQNIKVSTDVQSALQANLGKMNDFRTAKILSSVLPDKFKDPGTMDTFDSTSYYKDKALSPQEIAILKEQGSKNIDSMWANSYKKDANGNLVTENGHYVSSGTDEDVKLSQQKFAAAIRHFEYQGQTPEVQNQMDIQDLHSYGESLRSKLLQGESMGEMQSRLAAQASTDYLFSSPDSTAVRQLAASTTDPKAPTGLTQTTGIGPVLQGTDNAQWARVLAAQQPGSKETLGNRVLVERVPTSASVEATRRSFYTPEELAQKDTTSDPRFILKVSIPIRQSDGSVTFVPVGYLPSEWRLNQAEFALNKRPGIVNGMSTDGKFEVYNLEKDTLGRWMSDNNLGAMYADISTNGGISNSADKPYVKLNVTQENLDTSRQIFDGTGELVDANKSLFQLLQQAKTAVSPAERQRNVEDIRNRMEIEPFHELMDKAFPPEVFGGKTLAIRDATKIFSDSLAAGSPDTLANGINSRFGNVVTPELAKDWAARSSDVTPMELFDAMHASFKRGDLNEVGQNTYRQAVSFFQSPEFATSHVVGTFLDMPVAGSKPPGAEPLPIAETAPVVRTPQVAAQPAETAKPAESKLIVETNPDGKPTGDEKLVRSYTTRGGQNMVEVLLKAPNSPGAGQAGAPEGYVFTEMMPLEKAQKKFQTTDPELLANRLVNPHDGWNAQTEKYQEATSSVPAEAKPTLKTAEADAPSSAFNESPVSTKGVPDFLDWRKPAAAKPATETKAAQAPVESEPATVSDQSVAAAPALPSETTKIGNGLGGMEVKMQQPAEDRAAAVREQFNMPDAVDTSAVEKATPRAYGRWKGNEYAQTSEVFTQAQQGMEPNSPTFKALEKAKNRVNREELKTRFRALIEKNGGDTQKAIAEQTASLEKYVQDVADRAGVSVGPLFPDEAAKQEFKRLLVKIKNDKPRQSITLKEGKIVPASEAKAPKFESTAPIDDMISAYTKAHPEDGPLEVFRFSLDNETANKVSSVEDLEAIVNKGRANSDKIVFTGIAGNDPNTLIGIKYNEALANRYKLAPGEEKLTKRARMLRSLEENVYKLDKADQNNLGSFNKRNSLVHFHEPQVDWRGEDGKQVQLEFLTVKPKTMDELGLFDPARLDLTDAHGRERAKSEAIKQGVANAEQGDGNWEMTAEGLKEYQRAQGIPENLGYAKVAYTRVVKGIDGVERLVSIKGQIHAMQPTRQRQLERMMGSKIPNTTIIMPEGNVKLGTAAFGDMGNGMKGLQVPSDGLRGKIHGEHNSMDAKFSISGLSHLSAADGVNADVSGIYKPTGEKYAQMLKEVNANREDNTKVRAILEKYKADFGVTLDGDSDYAAMQDVLARGDRFSTERFLDKALASIPSSEILSGKKAIRGTHNYVAPDMELKGGKTLDSIKLEDSAEWGNITKVADIVRGSTGKSGARSSDKIMKSWQEMFGEGSIKPEEAKILAKGGKEADVNLVFDILDNAKKSGALNSEGEAFLEQERKRASIQHDEIMLSRKDWLAMGKPDHVFTTRQPITSRTSPATQRVLIAEDHGASLGDGVSVASMYDGVVNKQFDNDGDAYSIFPVGDKPGMLSPKIADAYEQTRRASGDIVLDPLDKYGKILTDEKGIAKVVNGALAGGDAVASTRALSRQMRAVDDSKMSFDVKGKGGTKKFKLALNKDKILLTAQIAQESTDSVKYKNLDERLSTPQGKWAADDYVLNNLFGMNGSPQDSAPRNLSSAIRDAGFSVPFQLADENRAMYSTKSFKDEANKVVALNAKIRASGGAVHPIYQAIEDTFSGLDPLTRFPVEQHQASDMAAGDTVKTAMEAKYGAPALAIHPGTPEAKIRDAVVNVQRERQNRKQNGMVQAKEAFANDVLKAVSNGTSESEQFANLPEGFSQDAHKFAQAIEEAKKNGSISRWIPGSKYNKENPGASIFKDPFLTKYFDEKGFNAQTENLRKQGNQDVVNLFKQYQGSKDGLSPEQIRKITYFLVTDPKANSNFFPRGRGEDVRRLNQLFLDKEVSDVYYKARDAWRPTAVAGSTTPMEPALSAEIPVRMKPSETFKNLAVKPAQAIVVGPTSKFKSLGERIVRK